MGVTDFSCGLTFTIGREHKSVEVDKKQTADVVRIYKFLNELQIHMSRQHQAMDKGMQILEALGKQQQGSISVAEVPSIFELGEKMLDT